MHQFTVHPDGFKEVRKKTLPVITGIFLIIVLVAIILYFWNGSADDSPDTLPYFIVVFAVIFLFSGFKAVKKRKEMFESFRLMIGEGAVVREQLNTPTITIERNDIRKIVKCSTGELVVVGPSKLSSIIIPSHIKDRTELERLLSEIRPVTQDTSKPWARYLILLATVVGMVLLFVGFGRENKIISALCGTVICMIMLWGFIVIQKSKNADNRLKRVSYILIIPFISVLYVTILMLMS